MTFSEPYKNFLLSMWLQCRLTEAQVSKAVTDGKLTQAEADAILSAPRDCP